MRARLGLVFSVTLAGAIGSACESNPDTPPLGFGVRDEAALVGMLAMHGMSDRKASCVARVAFAEDPSTENFRDGSYEITQAMLAGAGRDCEVDWSDFDFTGD